MIPLTSEQAIRRFTGVALGFSGSWASPDLPQGIYEFLSAMWQAVPVKGCPKSRAAPSSEAVRQWADMRRSVPTATATRALVYG